MPFEVFYAQLCCLVSNLCLVYLFVNSFLQFSFLLCRPNTRGRLSKVSEEGQVFYEKYVDLLDKLVTPEGFKGVTMSEWYDHTWSTIPTKSMIVVVSFYLCLNYIHVSFLCLFYTIFLLCRSSCYGLSLKWEFSSL